MNYGTIIVDPPWPYNDEGGPTGNAGRGRPGKKIVQVGIANHYPPMSVDELRRLPVGQIAAPDAVLFLWTTNAFMVETHELAVGWGFRPNTILTWGKVKADRDEPSMKTGHWFRGATEHIVFAVRGRPPRPSVALPTLHLYPRSNHSTKPSLFVVLAEQVGPPPRIELFARRVRPGWDRWGNEVESTIRLEVGQ